MNPLISRWSLVAVAVLLLASTAWASQQATGIVKGSVRGPRGPVAAARVEIDSASDSTYTGTATTDRDGNFTFSDAPLGGIAVRVYDADEHVIATGKGVLRHAGEVITLILQAP